MQAAQDLGDRLMFLLPTPKSWLSRLTPIPALIVWLLLEGYLIYGMLSDRNWHQDSVAGIVEAVVWTAIGILGIYIVLWRFFGKEVLEASSKALSIEKSAMGIGRKKVYAAGHVRNLRTVRYNRTLKNLPKNLVWLTPAYSFMVSGVFSTSPLQEDSSGPLAFDYGHRTIRFAPGLDEAEAKQIVAEIQNKFPQYRSDDFSRS